MEELWQTEFDGDERACDVHISNLRQKVERDPQRPELVVTVRGVGYKFEGRRRPRPEISRPSAVSREAALITEIPLGCRNIKRSPVMSQASIKNPYRPGVGVRPLYLAGRDPSLRRFDAMLRAAPEQQASMRVAGLRGVGKTVLLGAFAERAEEANWEPADLEFQPSHNTDEALQEALGGLLGRARARLSRLERLRRLPAGR